MLKNDRTEDAPPSSLKAERHPQKASPAKRDIRQIRRRLHDAGATARTRTLERQDAGALPLGDTDGREGRRNAQAENPQEGGHEPVERALDGGKRNERHDIRPYGWNPGGAGPFDLNGA